MHTTVVFHILCLFIYKVECYAWNSFSVFMQFVGYIVINKVLTTCHYSCRCCMLRVVRRSMADSAVARSFRLVLDRVDSAARRRPAVCLSALTSCGLCCITAVLLSKRCLWAVLTVFLTFTLILALT